MASETTTTVAPKLARAEQIFPTLTVTQIARIATRGHVRKIDAGEVLIEVGRRDYPFFLVTAGQVEVVRQLDSVDTIVVVHAAGQFTGEVNMIAGRPALFRVRVREAGEVIELSRERIVALVQNDAELSEILMRAFILRRAELLASGLGDVVLLGSLHSPETLRIREFLTRNGHPYAYIDLDREPDVQQLLDHFHIELSDVPVLICQGGRILKSPTNQKIADCLGFNDEIDQAVMRDIVIVGAGPSGLAAAVYGASEGLDVLVLESTAPGGQAGSSSKIENYLGFPTGISGQNLAARAYTQAQKFGAKILIAKGAVKLTCSRKPYAVEIDDGLHLAARTVIIATGAEYRRLAINNLSRFENAGVYYGATPMEAQLCAGDEVIVVGGGNSAGQAAVFLSQTARRVYMLVRSRGLAETMSRYLIRRIEDNPAIELRTHTEVVTVEGNEHLERVQWRDTIGGQTEMHDVRHLFVMAGAVPNSRWLNGCVALDDKGFIRTGPDLSPDDLAAAGWPLARPPYLLETSLPGVFAVGDVRGGNIKRVASAVGEGSIAVAFVHKVLIE